MFNIDATLVMVITSLLLPVLVGLVTKLNAPTGVKYVVTLFCASVAALINLSITVTGTAVVSKEAATLALVTFLVTTLSYLGLYRPASSPLRPLATIAPAKGIGPAQNEGLARAA